MASARLGSARLGSARLGSARLGSARLGSARLGSARLGSARLGSARLGSARLGSARLGSARLGSARLGSARLGSARLGSARLGSARSARLIIADAKRALDVKSFVESSIPFFPPRRSDRDTARASTPHVPLSSLTMVTSSACTRGCGATLPGPASAPAFRAPPGPLPASRTAHRGHPRPTRARRPKPRAGSGTRATMDYSVQLNYCKYVVFMP